MGHETLSPCAANPAFFPHPLLLTLPLLIYTRDCSHPCPLHPLCPGVKWHTGVIPECVQRMSKEMGTGSGGGSIGRHRVERRQPPRSVDGSGWPRTEALCWAGDVYPAHIRLVRQGGYHSKRRGWQKSGHGRRASTYVTTPHTSALLGMRTDWTGLSWSQHE